LEINSASFWVCEEIEEKRRVMEEWKLRCEGFRRNAIIDFLRKIFSESMSKKMKYNKREMLARCQ